MYLQKETSKKGLKKKFLIGHWRKKQDPDPDADPLVIGMDPRIPIRTNMIKQSSVADPDPEPDP